MNSIGLYRVPYDNNGCYQFVAPDYYCFYKNGERLGKIIWRKMSEIEGIYTDEDNVD